MPNLTTRDDHETAERQQRPNITTADGTYAPGCSSLQTTLCSMQVTTCSDRIIRGELPLACSDRISCCLLEFLYREKAPSAVIARSHHLDP